MKKIIFLLVVCAALYVSCDYFKWPNREIPTEKEHKIVETNDTVWYCDMTHSFCRKLKIDNEFTIIFNGKVCKIGTFDDEIIDDTLKKVFNSCLAFEGKSKYVYGFKEDDDLDDLIAELERGKKALIRCSEIAKRNNINHHIESFVTGNPPTFGIGSSYCKEGDNEYIELHSITTGNEEFISTYNSLKECKKSFNYLEGKNDFNDKYITFNMNAELKFHSVSQFDTWISKLKQFKKNKFIKFDDCFKS